MQHPDEGTIHAWLDGQLPQDEGAKLEAHARECASCAAAIAEARGLVAASSRIVSALDIVPGGVIPAAAQAGKVKRPWYASSQLRAAAAVLFVAAASMLVLQDQGTPDVGEMARRAAKTEAAAPAESPAMPQAMDEKGLQRGVDLSSKAAAASPLSGNTPTTPRAPEAIAGKVAAEADQSAQAFPAPPPPPAAPAAPAAPAESRAASGAMLKAAPVVVTGVAAASDAVRQEELTLVRTDTAGASNVRVYRVAGGVEVTLAEAPAALPTATARRREGAREAAPERAAPAPAAASPPIASITWTDAETRKTYVLSGPLPKERLEQLRKEIEAKSR